MRVRLGEGFLRGEVAVQQCQVAILAVQFNAGSRLVIVLHAHSGLSTIQFQSPPCPHLNFFTVILHIFNRFTGISLSFPLHHVHIRDIRIFDVEKLYTGNL